MIIIGDVHGCYKTLIKLIGKLPENEEIVFVGDLIDRGPLSRLVVKLVRERRYKCVKGNHEQMMIEEKGKVHVSGTWVNNGGVQTVKNYRGHEDQLKDDLKWMETLPSYIEFKDIKNENGEYLVVSHSAVNSAWPWRNSQKKEAVNNYIMWNRDPVVQNQGIFNIFGHTIVEEADIADYYANIDTGCFSGKTIKGECGSLTAIQFPSMKIYNQEKIDK